MTVREQFVGLNFERIKMKKTLASITLLLLSCSAIALPNRNQLSQCSVVLTVMSARYLDNPQTMQGVKRLQNLNIKYATEVFGSMEAFAEYNKSYGMEFYQWLKVQSSETETQVLQGCVTMLNAPQ